MSYILTVTHRIRHRAKYFEKIEDTGRTVLSLSDHVISDDCVYDFQVYQILTWLTVHGFEVPTSLFEYAVGRYVEPSTPNYLRSAIVELLARASGDVGLDVMRRTFQHGAPDLQTAEIICALNIRKAFNVRSIRSADHSGILTKFAGLKCSTKRRAHTQSTSDLFDFLSRSASKEKYMAFRDRVRIGIITILPKELSAAKAVFGPLEQVSTGDNTAGNRYAIAQVESLYSGSHFVAIATCDKGNNLAANRATKMISHFPSMRDIIVVGIGGGVPDVNRPDDHVRLGDVVVSDGMGTFQFDMGKRHADGFEYKPPPRPPSAYLLEAVTELIADGCLTDGRWRQQLSEVMLPLGVVRPNLNKDRLFATDEPHVLLTHPDQPLRIVDMPMLHVGCIASSNSVLRDPSYRDVLRDDYNVKAVEMEASGIADATWTDRLDYLVVRGIADYCDSHKNDEWHRYAATVAMSFTKVLISYLHVPSI